MQNPDGKPGYFVLGISPASVEWRDYDYCQVGYPGTSPTGPAMGQEAASELLEKRRQEQPGREWFLKEINPTPLFIE